MHLMIIPDGDRRYAQKYAIPLDKAYKKAAQVAYDLVKWVLVNHNIKEYTFFSLSLANIKERKGPAIEAIFKAQAEAFRKAAEDPFFQEHKIKIRGCGSIELLPDYYQEAIKEAEEATKQNGTKTFNPLVAYSGAEDLRQAVEKVVTKKLKITSENIFKNCLINTPIDFLIRTANEKRISDAPPLALKYTEFHFINKLFPELNEAYITKALTEYENRKRTYGK